MAPVTCIVHTRDSEATVETALRSVAWADELLVVDMKSRDRTREIAAAFGSRILDIEPKPRVDAARNPACRAARHDWILVLDSDEYLAADGRESVRGLIGRHGDAYHAFAIPRYNLIAGQVIRSGRWYPDHQIRLFRKGKVWWDDATHLPPRVEGGTDRLLRLDPPDCLHIYHNSYPNLSAFIQKQLHYAVNDRYEEDPLDFAFQDYIAGAYDILAGRGAPEMDGDLAYALATILAWNNVIRGLIHWDRLDPRPPLEPLFSLPLTPLPADEAAVRQHACEEDLSALRGQLAAMETELAAIKNTRAWRAHAFMQQHFPRLLHLLGRLTGHKPAR